MAAGAAEGAPRWLLTATESLGGGRSRLTFLIDNSARRIVQCWGDPPSDTIVAKCGALLVMEQDARPIGKRYHLSDAPTDQP